VRFDPDEIREALGREEVRSISRRYFISNGFDGTLTSVGVAVGAVLSGIADGLVVFQIGVGAAVGLGTSGVWSVWEIERAEKRAEIRGLERAMLTDLDDTKLMQRKEGARLVNAVFSGIGPLIGILLPMLPFLLAGPYLGVTEAAVVSGGIAVGLLFVFGAYMGAVAQLTPSVSRLRMGLAGLVVAAINWLLPG
jgi:predicted membrane protein (TIGR00267 family)